MEFGAAAEVCDALFGHLAFCVSAGSDRAGVSCSCPLLGVTPFSRGAVVGRPRVPRGTPGALLLSARGSVWGRNGFIG